jgi:hypothetical protein
MTTEGSAPVPESEDAVSTGDVGEIVIDDEALSAEAESEPVSSEPAPATIDAETDADSPAASDAAPESADVAEEPVAESVVPESADAALVEGTGGGLSWIPFALYMGLWVIFVGVAAYYLYGVGGDQPARWAPVYRPLLWGGVGLTALGPVLSFVVWLFARAGRPKEHRRGLFASAMTRGALVAFSGVVIWLGTLFLLELLAARGTL